ncbi:MAG: DASH family cryptochrome [Pseudomonadota bacterium]
MNAQKHSTSLYWLTQDLRLDDNPTLIRACEKSEKLILIYTVNPTWFTHSNFGQLPLGTHRWRFLHQSLMDLQESLMQYGQHLLLTFDEPIKTISKLIQQYSITGIFRSLNVGFYEMQDWQRLQEQHPGVYFEETCSHTLFNQSNLPASLANFPSSFSKFRKNIEPLTSRRPLEKPSQLPPPPKSLSMEQAILLPSYDDYGIEESRHFNGGSTIGKQHLKNYFQSDLPSSYKQVRNALDGWENSTKFSPWLANGCVSPHQILFQLHEYEMHVESNESTYWIAFELLWREYFQWLAFCYSTCFFTLGGIKQQQPTSNHNEKKYVAWCQGQTAYPLVNACMQQLNITGFMSNRGRQIVASCFVNELNLDWRYGAAYFEYQLIDYDVASNWGNWQYLAGVGTDPRGQRHFDLKKQMAQFDPDGRFVNHWT